MREFKMENETTIEVGETYRFADLWSGNGAETLGMYLPNS